MINDDSIFIRRRFAISIVCTILIIYPNLMWMPWNVAALQPGELVAFWATAVFRCLFFFCLFYLQIGFNLKRLSDARFFPRLWKNILFSLAGATVFIAISLLIPLLNIQSATVGKYLMFQFIVVPLICTFIGYIAVLNEERLVKEKEIERLKLENLLSRYNALANHINPHFFFNSLNGISSLVRRGDEEMTLEYIDRLSDIFRYILRNDTDRLVPLSEEIRFVEAFSHVLEVRFRGKLTFDINIGKGTEQSKIPVLSLLPLLENVSTHNRIDSDHKMTVRIYSENGYLIVSNAKCAKNEKVDTNGSGLNNLNMRFELLTGRGIEIDESDNFFTVKMPL